MMEWESAASDLDCWDEVVLLREKDPKSRIRADLDGIMEIAAGLDYVTYGLLQERCLDILELVRRMR